MNKKRTNSTSSDRWSKASSDSDASFISSPGELRFDRTRASDVKDLLETFAQLSGGRDKKGFLLITILSDATQDDTSIEDLRKIVLYLTESSSPEDQEEGFTFLVSLKPAPPYGTIKPLVKVLQDYFPFKVIHIYVVKPEGYKDKLLSGNSLTSSKFLITVVTKDILFKYISLGELTEEFGGTRKYDHVTWFKMRLAFEKFLFESMALSSKLDEIKRSLLADGIADSVDGARDQLQHHQYVRKWIIKAPIEILDEQSKKVINTIKTTSECASEDDLKGEYKNCLHQVRGMIGTLQDQRSTLKDLWMNRRNQLEQSYQFNVFTEDAEKMLAWIMENRQDFLCNFSEIGEDLEMAEELCEEHKQFEETCGDVQVNIDRILQVANRLREMQNFDTELVDRLASKLESEWNKLYTAVERRSTMLQASVSFHKSSEQYVAQCKIWMEELNAIERKDIDSKEVYEEAIRINNALKQSMTESYEFVNSDSKHLLNCLQRTPSGDSREEKARSRLSDYTDAASHVMDVIVVLYEQNKQLMIMWEKQKVRISQKFQLSLYVQKCNEVLSYLHQGTGNVFLEKNSWVGDDASVAESLLCEQNDFENIFQETYLKAKKLLDTGNQLAESKECDPSEVRQKQSYLENEVKSFTSKLKKRRELLKMAVSFYKNFKKLSKTSEKLKQELNLDGVDASAEEDALLDVELENHREECENTLERLLSTVHEGEQLIAELTEEVKTNAGKDSRTSWFSTGANSIEQSRLAVELYLKELNHNRQQLEKMWHGRQKKLEYWIQVKHYERDFNVVCGDAMKWNTLWLKKELSCDISKALSMVERFEKEFNDLAERFHSLLNIGRDLENVLCSCGVQVVVTLNDDIKEDGLKYIGDLLKRLHDVYDNMKKVHNKLKIKYEFTIKQRKLESEAKKVSGWVRHGESILQASQEAVFSMYEAEATLREYERFHVAIETTKLGVMDIRENALKLIRDGHPDHETINQVAGDVEKKWKQLMQHAEERRAVVFSSYNFYRAAEQVRKLLEKFSKDCKCDGDPCSKFEDYELKFKREKIEALIKKSEPERKAVEDGCLKVKECSEEFLKRVLPSGDGNITPIIDGPMGRLEITVNDLVEQVTSQEAFVLKQIQLRKNVLIGCAECVSFQENVKILLKSNAEKISTLSGAVKFLQESELKDETIKMEHMQAQEEYKAMFLQMREKVKFLLNEAADIVARNHYHRNTVSELATKINTHYKDIACLIKQHGEALVEQLGCSISCLEEEEGWPGLSATQIQSFKINDVARRDVSKEEEGEMAEKKRRSVKRIEFIMNELLQTEKAYVDDLKCCIDNFLIPMYNSPDAPDALRGFEEVIFGNIEMIHEFHSNVFLGEVTKYEKCADDVGKCFIEWADKFHMYVDFCANKQESNDLLIKHGETFFEDLQLRRGLGLSIAAYLIKPVQRITKYQLLLKDLLSCCDDEDGTLQGGLEVMLSVPQRANDAMYLCMIKGFDDGSLETLGKILLQDCFTVADPKHILKKGKERHLFLFEQALLLCKEIKDAYGKCTFEYKCKLKTSEMGITEHVAEDKCKFAVWTGNPPLTEEKRIIKAESEVVKQMWVKEIRELIQQFQFGILKARTNFYPTSPRRKSVKKTNSQGEVSLNSDNTFNTERVSAEFDTATICSRTSLENNSNLKSEAMYLSTSEYTAKALNEISLRMGQNVEVLSKPPGSRSWRVRIVDNDLDLEVEGFVPSQLLRKVEDSPLRGKRSSVETLNSQSSEDSLQTESPKGSMQSVSTTSSKQSPKSNRRRAKSSVNLGGTLTKQMKTWSRGSAKKSVVGDKPPLPITPTRNKSISGGGSKKLQALLGAPESDIDLLIRPSDSKFGTLGRSTSVNSSAEKVKFTPTPTEHVDVESQESDNDSLSDSADHSKIPISGDNDHLCLKRVNVLQELIDSENAYISELETLITKFIPAINRNPNLPEELLGKEKIMFGNVRELLTFHKEIFVVELTDCLHSLDNVAPLFINYEKKFELYINYCANMPRSASLIHDYLDTFFSEISLSLEPGTRIEEYLMKPVQRIMKYYIMLKDFTKYTSRAGADTGELTKALHIMQVVPKKADDVMNVGMLEGFPGNLNNQGKLLMQDSLSIANVKTQSPPQERKVFLFEKLLLFGEPLERKSNLLCYIYRHSIETHTIGLTANYDDDLTKFALWSKRDSGSSELYHMTARSPTVKKAWVESIKKITEEQYFKSRSMPKILSPKSSSVCNGGPTSPTQVIDAGLQHVKLIPLDEAKCLEELTNPFPAQEKYTVTQFYLAQNMKELTIHKHEVVYLTSRPKKGDQFYSVRTIDDERSGLVPVSILKKINDRKGSTDKSKIRRSLSVGEKTKREISKIPKMNLSGSLLRNTSLKRKKNDKRKASEDDSTSSNSSTPKTVLGKLHQHWASNFDSSEDEDSLKEGSSITDEGSNCLFLSVESTESSASEMAPEFKIRFCDVSVDVASYLKLTCTVAAHPTPTVDWSRDGMSQEELLENDQCRITCKNQLCCLEILSTKASDSGRYTCRARNKLGSMSCSANVLVKSECKPGAPSKPYVVTKTGTTVTLGWGPPPDAHKVPVKAYSVQCREENEQSWRVVVPVCTQPHATVDDLKTGCKYSFRVGANNEVGMSENSQPTELILLSNDTDEHDPHTDRLYTDFTRPHEIRWRENIEEHYNICGELGRGRFSIVKRCVEKTSNKEFAAKIVRRRMMSKESVESEVAILQALNHPSIVYVHEIYDAPKGLVIIEQLLAGGRLFDHIVIMDMLTEEIAISYIRQLLIALKYIHAKNIAHLDIKPENILLAMGEKPRVVVSDFGEAIRLGSVPYHHELTGTPEFAAPEIVANDSVSLKTDMWSVGVIVYVLLSGISPFYSDNTEHACTNVTEIRYKFPDDFFTDISDEAQDFIEELLIRDQAHRPDAEECLNFAWIRMGDPENRTHVRKSRINLVYLAAFNARRRYQYESSNRNPSTPSSQLLMPEDKGSSGGGHRR